VWNDQSARQAAEKCWEKKNFFLFVLQPAKLSFKSLYLLNKTVQKEAEVVLLDERKKDG